MDKYYYEYNGELQEIELQHGTVTNFRKSNPHLVIKTAAQVLPEDKVAVSARMAADSVRALRRAEYPPISDQLDAIMKWAFSENEIGLPAELKSLAAKCMSVKAKYPLPE